MIVQFPPKAQGTARVSTPAGGLVVTVSYDTPWRQVFVSPGSYIVRAESEGMLPWEIPVTVSVGEAKVQLFQ